MISDFMPVPELGVKYKTQSGDILLVKDILENLGGIPDTVVFTWISGKNESKEFEAQENEWNNMGLQIVTKSQPVDEPSEPSEPSGPQKKTDDEPKSSEPSDSSTIKQQGDSSDVISKIKQVETLLNNGPLSLNQEFFPTDKNLSENNMVEKDVEEAFQNTLDEIDHKREMGRYEDTGSEENTTKRKRRRAGFINEFLWSCGGLDKDLLRMCPTDWAKKAGMGGTILGTAVLATFSGGFAAYTVADNTYVAIVIGIVWGLVIFNLDRYLVNSMYSDGKPTISRKEFMSGLPRIIIAIFLGIVISTPIELKIFEGAINEEAHKEQVAKKNIKGISQRNPKLQEIKEQLKDKKEKLEGVEKEYKKQLDLVQKESEGKRGNEKGYGPTAKRLAKDANKFRTQELEPLRKQIFIIEQEYDSVYEKAFDKTQEEVSEEVGLSKQIELLLRATDQAPMNIVRVLIALMFIILEILPVVNKMMQTDGEYDRLIDLESDTRAKLTRIKEFNNINVLRSGYLGIYRKQILGYDIKEDSDESNTPFAKHDTRKENKIDTDQDNQEIYKFARKRCKMGVLREIAKIFPEKLDVDSSDKVDDDNSDMDSKNKNNTDKDIPNDKPKTSDNQDVNKNLDPSYESFEV